MKGRIIVAGLLVIAALEARARTVTLSPDQLQRLDDGEVLLLDVLPPGGASAPRHGGTAMTVVQAPPDAVWRVLVDYPSHREVYPQVVKAEVLESGARHALVRYEIGVGPFSFRFHVRHSPDPKRRRLEWRLDRTRSNDLFRDSWGYWQVDPRGRGSAIVTYAMASRTVLPAFLMRGAERQGLIRTIEAVRERAEAARRPVADSEREPVSAGSWIRRPGLVKTP